MNELIVDVAVIGAGLAGVCAAISAARHGSKVVLVGDRPVLGGNSSSEIRVWTRGATGGGNLFSEEMGVLGELKLRNLFTNLDGNPVLWDEVLLDSILNESNITLLLNTHITDVDIENNKKIISVTGFQLSSENIYKIIADRFIDSTGDGTIGSKSGISFFIGKESSKSYGEDLAPEKEEKNVLGSTIFFHTKRTEKPVKFIAPNYAYGIEYIENIIGNGGRVVNENMSGVDYWWFEFGGIINTISDNQKIYIELKKFVLGVWNYIKNSGKFDADYLTLEWIGNIPGKRESRRFIGNYVLTVNDILENKKFDDAVCYGGWFLDYHPSEGIFTKDKHCTQIPVGLYQIPLRSFYSSKINNLVFAGRDLSISHSAFASTRIMNTCGLTGQVAGTVSAYSIKNRVDPDSFNNLDINKIQLELIRDDMFIPGLKLKDYDDLTQNSKIKSSSYNCRNVEQWDTLLDVDELSFITLSIPKKGGKIKLLMKWEKETMIKLKLTPMTVPSRYNIKEPLEIREIHLEGDSKEEWISIELSEEYYGKFLVINFEENNNIKICGNKKKSTGFLMGSKFSSEYMTPCFILENIDEVYEPNNVIAENTRPYCGANVWMADLEDAKPWIELSWDYKIEVKEIALFLNPELSEEIPSSRNYFWNDHHMLTAREKMPDTLIKAFTVYYNKDGQWIELFKEECNWKRLIKINGKNVITNKIKVDIHETYGGNAEIFKISVY